MKINYSKEDNNVLDENEEYRQKNLVKAKDLEVGRYYRTNYDVVVYLGRDKQKHYCYCDAFWYPKLDESVTIIKTKTAKKVYYLTEFLRNS